MSESSSDLTEFSVEDFLHESSAEVQSELEELTMPDLTLYEDEGPSRTAPQLASISYRHHRMAQLVALGHTKTTVATMLACTYQTVVRLCKDPTFKILVEAELEKLQTRDHALQVKLSEVAEVGLDTLHTMLINGDGKAPLKPTVVKDITMDVLDRAGHGPSRQVTVNKNFGIEASTIERIKENAKPSRRLPCIAIEADAIEATGEETSVGGTNGESVSEPEDSEGTLGPGSYLPAEVFPISGEET